MTNCSCMHTPRATANRSRGRTSGGLPRRASMETYVWTHAPAHSKSRHGGKRCIMGVALTDVSYDRLAGYYRNLRRAAR